MIVLGLNSLGQFIKSTFMGGLLVILPLCLVVMLGMKTVGALKQMIAPIMERFPDGLRFPTMIATLLLLIVCFSACF